MTEWYDNRKKARSDFRKSLQEQIKKTNPRRKLYAEETKRLKKLEAIAEKLKRGENVQNRQLQMWLSADIVSLPRLVTSRSHEKLSDDSRLTSKQSVKLAVVELAMCNIGRGAVPDSKDDVSKLDKFLNADD